MIQVTLTYTHNNEAYTVVFDSWEEAMKELAIHNRPVLQGRATVKIEAV